MITKTTTNTDSLYPRHKLQRDILELTGGTWFTILYTMSLQLYSKEKLLGVTTWGL
jgi:hypothetical protein